SRSSPCGMCRTSAISRTTWPPSSSAAKSPGRRASRLAYRRSATTPSATRAPSCSVRLRSSTPTTSTSSTSNSESHPVRSPLRLLALDLGAESGRAMVGKFDGSLLEIEEAHRFANVPVRLAGTLCWAVLRLFGDIISGMRAALTQGELASVGVDAWGVDFGLLDERGRLL